MPSLSPPDEFTPGLVISPPEWSLTVLAPLFSGISSSKELATQTKCGRLAPTLAFLPVGFRLKQRLWSSHCLMSKGGPEHLPAINTCLFPRADRCSSPEQEAYGLTRRHASAHSLWEEA